MNNYQNKRTVAVIIASYKCSGTIHRALSSIMKQTHPVEETIIVDDWSTESDKIKAIAESFPKVRYICSENRLGVAGARNVGIFAANSEVVALMDADDELHPQRIEIQLKYVTANSVVTCDVVRLTDKANHEYVTFSKERIKSNYSACLNALFPRIPGATLMGETALLRKVGGYDKDLPGVDDFEIYLRLLNQGYTVKKVMLPLYIYRDMPGSASKNKLKIWRSYVKMMEKFLTARFGSSASWLAVIFWSLIIGKEFIRSVLNNDRSLRKAVLGEGWRIFPFFNKSIK